jgi:hypothetical protein
MELVAGLVALAVGIGVFIGANLVALALMIGGAPSDPAVREPRR